MKVCYRCKETKDYDAFKRDKNRTDGRYPYCKACCKAERDANKDALLAYAKAYYADHADERRAYARQRAKENPERVAESRRKYLGSPKGQEWWKGYLPRHNARGQAWRRANSSYMNTYQQRWGKAHPENWLVQRHARRARKARNGGRFTQMQWRLLKARYHYTCLCCGEREPAIKLSPDHVIPLAKGGGNDIGNIQPLCGPCNRRKYLATTDYRPAELSAP